MSVTRSPSQTAADVPTYLTPLGLLVVASNARKCTGEIGALVAWWNRLDGTSSLEYSFDAFAMQFELN